MTKDINFMKKNYIYIVISIIIIIYSLFIQYRYKAYFFPSKKINYTPSDFNIPYKEINIDKLNGWLFKNQSINEINKVALTQLPKQVELTQLPKQVELTQLPKKVEEIKPIKKLIIFYHGNAGNISNRIWIIKQLLEIFSDTDIFIYDYPQFGLSSGQLSLTDIIKSAYAVYLYWSNKYKHISLLGESIGAGVIAELFKLLVKTKHHNMPKVIIHLNGLTSLYGVINNIIPTIIKPFILPWITEFDCETIYWQNVTKLPKLLILHTPNDEIININLVYKLIKKLSYSENVHFIKIDGSHNQPIIDSECIKKIRYIVNDF